MNRSNQPWRPAETAELDWSSAQSPCSVRFGDFYHSLAGGLEESDHIYLKGNQLPARWAAHAGEEFCILETGFGTGLNFLQTWRAWRDHREPRPRLHYLSIDKYPLAVDDLARALTRWPALAHCAGQLVANYPLPLHGAHRVILEDGRLILDLWWEDVAAVLADLAADGKQQVDAWYLDGFAPARNPGMWGDELYHNMRRISRQGATFGTFTAASDVRRGLSKAGFRVAKVPGFGGKRESLRGELQRAASAAQPSGTPWHIPKNPQEKPASALILGAGLAGCTVAAALARRGIEVTLLEQNRIAGAGSGQAQGILYTRLSTTHSSLTDFALASFCFAQNYYRALFAAGSLREGRDGALCGNFQLSDAQGELSALRDALALAPNLAAVLDAPAASGQLGVEVTSGGFWFPRSGWLHPAAVCRALIDHPLIDVREKTGAIALARGPTSWQGVAGGREIASADCAIIATGTSTIAIPGLSWLPLQAIRGQTTVLPTSAALGRLRSGLCHTGYISPARGKHHCIGATFDLRDDDDTVRAGDHGRNLSALADAIPAWSQELLAIDPESLQGRVGYRCATSDYLPVVGALPDRDSFLSTYAALRDNAKQDIRECAHYRPGLYLSTGHGARGLTSTPLAAEVLASQICAEAQPLPLDLRRAIAPGRFLIRKLRRGLL